jgi:hypothetical protein
MSNSWNVQGVSSLYWPYFLVHVDIHFATYAIWRYYFLVSFAGWSGHKAAINTSEAFVLKQNFSWCRFEILTAVVTKNSLFWDITPCSPLKLKQYFGEIYHIHLQGRRIISEKNKREIMWNVMCKGWAYQPLHRDLQWSIVLRNHVESRALRTYSWRRCAILKLWLTFNGQHAVIS